MDVRRLIAYNHFLNRRLADYFVDECSWSELSENHETSHNTIANVMMHAVNMEDWWLHYVVPSKPWDGPKWDGFTSATEMRRRIHEVEAKTRKLLEGFTDATLREPMTLDIGGHKQTLTMEDVLVEVANEVTHHRGEVMAMLWRNDKTPPYVNFTDWMDEHEKAA